MAAMQQLGDGPATRQVKLNAAGCVPPFGTTVDPVRAGQAGGRAAALSRKLRKQRQLEEKILESRNGAAQAKLLEIQLRRDRALEDERLKLDTQIRELLDERYQLLELVEDVRDERDALLSEGDELRRGIAALELREAELKQRLESDAGLDEWLQEIGEKRVEAAGVRSGWAEATT